MSYLVLARKYRPASFSDIIGQEHVVRTLTNAIAVNRVHHAFLFTGARGVGKTSAARVLSRALNCANGPTPNPCGSCTACQEIASGQSPDVLEIDGASTTQVEKVRELLEKIRYLPSHGRFKLYIIDEVHMLSTSAFNALLKTLEEPPPHVKFILATTEPQKIPITILSRCQRFDFRRVSLQLLNEHLRQVLKKEKVELSASALAAISREAQGSVRDALSLLDQILSFAGEHGAAKLSDEQIAQALGTVDRETVFAFAEAILAKDGKGLLSLVAEVDSRGHDLGYVAGLLVEHWRDLLVVKISEQTAVLDRSPGEIEQLKLQAQKIESPYLHQVFSLLVQVAEDVSRASYPRVSFEIGLLRLLEVAPTQSLVSIIGKLDQLLNQSHNSKAIASKNLLEIKPGESIGKAEISSAMGFGHFVEKLRGLRPALASVLEHGHPLQFAKDGVTIAYAPNTFYWEAARERDNRELIERLLIEHFGTPVVMQIVKLETQAHPPVSKTIAELEEIKQRERQQKIRDDALAHPAVKGAIAILGGEIKEIIPLSHEEAEA